MPTYSQTGRLLAVTTPLGADKLLLERLRSEEALSEPFRLSLEVLCKRADAFDFDKLLGQAVTAKVMLPDGSFRFHNGVVAEVEETDEKQGAQGQELLRYKLEVVPKLFLLSLNKKSRIFQQLSVTDILKQVLTGFDVSWQTQGTYEPRDFCTQYRESDFAFASRLMEEEGIWYCFKHADGSHTMVVGDAPSAHAAVPGPATVSFQPGQGGAHPDDRIMRWSRKQAMRPGKATLWDQCFELPGQNLEAAQPVLATVAAGTKTHKLDAGGNSAIELYEYPGLYAQRFDGTAPGGGDRASDVQKIFQDNARTAKLRMEEATSRAVAIEGAGNVRHLCAGHTFTLKDHFNADGEYVLTRTRLEASIIGAYEGSGQADEKVEGSFECVPKALPFRPARKTPRPVIAGPQTAVVTGPSGQEIFTDKYGRIKVQFPWDREGKKDAASACWVRVGTPWAGKQWGMIHIPRIGQEVVVAFEDGDPDRPLAVGSVYNAENMPPYALPDNMTQSGMKSRSTKQGGADDFN
ncbi:MAG: type VI secretion system tip protein VgrG, partial [Gemmataceae bacterium]|nr:type VI secretion system tip protein VgrG [Gemmataceae bacterium]